MISERAALCFLLATLGSNTRLVKARAMMRHVGPVERWIRVAGGLVLMVLGITLSIPFWAEELAETVGLLAVGSGAVWYCPVKHVLARMRTNQAPGVSGPPADAPERR